MASWTVRHGHGSVEGVGVEQQRVGADVAEDDRGVSGQLAGCARELGGGHVVGQVDRPRSRPTRGPCAEDPTPSWYEVVVKASKPFWWMLWVTHDSPAMSTRTGSSMTCLPSAGRRRNVSQWPPVGAPTGPSPARHPPASRSGLGCDRRRARATGRARRDRHGRQGRDREKDVGRRHRPQARDEQQPADEEGRQDQQARTSAMTSAVRAAPTPQRRSKPAHARPAVMAAPTAVTTVRNPRAA